MEDQGLTQKRRLFEVKKKKVSKLPATKNIEKLIQINKYLPDGNQDESEDENLQNCLIQSIGFLDPKNTDWGNHLKGKEWVSNQKKIHESQFIEQSKVNKNLHKENRIVQIESSSNSPFLQSDSKTMFFDREFPNNWLSLTGQWGYLEKYKDVCWSKATSQIQECKIFGDKITPKDIIQGQLGDCYFLAALAALAERPDRIFSLFLVSQTNERKYFAVKILFKGRWTVIDMDEHFPFLNHTPVFSRAVRSELWVMILEKAWAKLHTNYMRISSGHAQEPLHDLTGAPIRFFNLKEKGLDKEELWKYLMKASKKEYSMCASSNKGSDEKMSETGIVQGHAYTLLNAIILSFQSRKIRLLQLRNPWGKKESVGNWCDKDSRWDKVSQQQKNRIHFEPTLKDGIFYIEFQDFLIEYRAITVAEINDNASYIYQTTKDPNIQGVFFKVELKETGHYSFQIDKTPKRSLNSKQQMGYRYPNAIVKIFSTFENYKEIHHFQDSQRLTSRRYSMYKGFYIVFVYIQFKKEYEKHYDVNLAIYSECPANIEVASTKQISKIQPISIRLKSPPAKSNSISRPKNNSKESKVNSIKFNYMSPLMSLMKSQLQANPNAIDHNVHLQVKEKRESKRGVLRIGGKPHPTNGEAKKHWGNNFDGQEWIDKQAQNHNSEVVPGIGKSILQLIEKQVTFIEPSPSHDQIKQSKEISKDFIDDRFPPNIVSLTGQWGETAEWKNVRWQRISKVMPKAKIFQGKISPQSIKQGFLGDCYFLAGIAALAQRPDRIFNLFLEHQRNESNYYSVKMLYKGKWLTINIDDYIPYMYDLPAFSRANKDELWVMLLEKAWAKIYSSFKRIEAGFPQETLHDLTGAPIRHIYLQKSTFDMEKQWKYLMNASAVQYSMVASSQPGADTLKSVTGIVGAHAYTLLSVAQLNFNNKIERLVQLRNPWGKGQNVGKWSDNDPNWNLIDEKTKARLGYAKIDDGIFFLPFESFCKEFKIITIAQINDNASYIYKSIKDPQKNGCFFKVQILQKGKYSFQVDSTPERTFEVKYNTDYRYPNIRFQLGILTDKGYIRRITTIESNTRTSFYGEQFEIGTYICLVRIDFDAKFEKDFDVNLAVYGDFACQVEYASRQQAILFSNDPNIKWKTTVQPNKKADVEWNALRSYRPDKNNRVHQ